MQYFQKKTSAQNRPGRLGSLGSSVRHHWSTLNISLHLWSWSGGSIITSTANHTSHNVCTQQQNQSSNCLTKTPVLITSASSKQHVIVDLMSPAGKAWHFNGNGRHEAPSIEQTLTYSLEPLCPQPIFLKISMD